jgi:hypothetical protein
MKFTPNKITVSLDKYRYYWRGEKKIGKSTLFRDVVKEAFGSYDAGLLISIGNERGHLALDGVYAYEANDWQSFTELIEDLVTNKTDNNFKLIGFDTCDELVSIAIDQVLKIHFRRKGEKAETINSALSGFGAGPRMVAEIINDQIAKLERAGYGLVFISHVKLKDIKEKSSEDSYQQLTGNLESRYDNIFADKADIISVFTTDRDITDKHVNSVQRFIYFRSNGFVDAGSRFANMPERVPMTAKDYIKAVEEGIRNSFMNPVDENKIEELRKIESDKKEKEISEYIDKVKLEKQESDNLTPEVLIESITTVLGEFTTDVKKQKREELKEANLPSAYKNLEDVEVLKKILKIIQSND